MEKSAIFLLTMMLGFSAGAGPLKVAVPEAVRASGIFNVLMPAFSRSTGIGVRIIPVSSGNVLAYAAVTGPDAVIANDEREKESFVRNGYGAKPRDFMRSDFVLAGPALDPVHAGAGWETSVARAFSRIASEKAMFISRNDSSAVHRVELDIWRRTGHVPGGSWYVPARQPMPAVLMMASQKQAYTLTDRMTFSALKKNLELDIIYDGDPILQETWSVIAISPKKNPAVDYANALRLAAWLISPDAQEIIAGFERKRERLFFPMTHTAQSR